MRIQQFQKKKGGQWETDQSNVDTLKKPLVLVFGNRYLLEDPTLIDEIRTMYPDGEIVMGSSAGEIIGANVFDNSIVLTAMEFEKSRFVVVRENILEYKKDAFVTGKKLSEKLLKEDLKHVFIVSEGSFVNGSALLEGLASVHKDVLFTGGLCGDDARFEKTLVGHNSIPKEGEIVAIGFYGSQLEITSAQFGGWTSFGPERIVTKSEHNVLYQLDEQPALDLYKKYLGEKASQLPQSALLYPLSVKTEGKKEAIVRTILSINEDNNTMILAGDVPEGAIVQLMMANIDNIAEGAYKAAEIGMKNRKNDPEIAILVSCIGRKLVMDQRVEEEVEEVVEVVGKKAMITGFYSYGELAPFSANTKCELHNQTMTLTLISE